ncbi:hypothetical protein GQX74_009200 [Glossina fuscipes]|nr:hypothetical protein GQX74_009200 [Glossina fuscipes]
MAWEYMSQLRGICVSLLYARLLCSKSREEQKTYDVIVLTSFLAVEKKNANAFSSTVCLTQYNAFLTPFRIIFLKISSPVLVLLLLPLRVCVIDIVIGTLMENGSINYNTLLGIVNGPYSISPDNELQRRWHFKMVSSFE